MNGFGGHLYSRNVIYPPPCGGVVHDNNGSLRLPGFGIAGGVSRAGTHSGNHAHVVAGSAQLT
ncbi:uncharacterized protein EI90DRAFT_3080278, partial [Cantharellus anzutake]|uniref:uncharacterized protein n=1 Tax=Cantharellus anzutake TaxID=1750568 RepID=UPI0019071F3E